MPLPVYNAGTDGRVRTAPIVAPAEAGGRPTPGTSVIVAEIIKWSKSSGGGGSRPSTVTLESAQDSIGVIDETHLERGGIRTTTFQVECLLNLTASLGITPNKFESLTNGFIDFIIDKSSTLGYHACYGTITDSTTTGADVNGRPVHSFTFRLNGTLPAIAAGT